MVRDPRIDIESLPFSDAIMRLVSGRGYEAYIVGGYVRDALLGRPTRDVDVVIKGPFDEIAREFADSQGGSFVVIGKERQIARAALPADVAWGGCQVDFSPLTMNIVEDLKQRDFTIDSLAVNLNAAGHDATGGIIDPLGGVSDLEARKIRATDPEVFRRDPVRLIRAIRLGAELEFALDEGTQRLMEREAGLMARASAERVRPELCGILASDKAYEWLRLMERLGLLSVLLPELKAGIGVAQPPEHYWDVYDHNLETVRALDQLLGRRDEGEDEFLASLSWADEFADRFAESASGGSGYPRRALVKLAGLLHDVAKPLAKTIDENGRIRFFEHAQRGAELAEVIMRRLRFSKQETALVKAVVYHHLRPGTMGHGDDLPTTRAIYKFFRDAGDAAIDTVFVNLADYRAARGPLLEWDEWRGYVDRCRYILYTALHRQELTEPKPLVNGHDLMRAFRLSPGPLVGRLLEEIREASAAGEVSTKEEALTLAGRSLASPEEGVQRR